MVGVRWVVSILSLTWAAGASGQVWKEVTPINVRRTGAFVLPLVPESSGAIRSRSVKGLFWTINDSSNPPTLFLADSTGRIRDTVRIERISNTDWEALSAGPCGKAWCLYIGDIGDNRAVRPSVTLFRVIEPSQAQLRRGTARIVDSLVVRYPDGPRDAEALVVTSKGDLAIITKGREGPPSVYRIPAASWLRGEVSALAVGKLPINTSIMLNELVTDAALSPDEKFLAVRTYRSLYLFQRGRLAAWLPDQPKAVCSLDGLDFQGEGLAWLDQTNLLLTSEVTRFGPGAITILECPGR